MPNFDQREFNQFVLDNNVVGFFQDPITLKSGRTSHFYVNWRGPSNDVESMDYMSNQVIEFTRKHELFPHCFYGVPEGATKLGVITQFKWGRMLNASSTGYPLPMGRGKPKEHGEPQDRFFLGMPKGRTIVLEDVTTTGDSLLTTIDTLVEAHVGVIAAIGLTNRMELRDDGKSVKEAVNARGFPYFALSDALELLHLAYAREDPGLEVARAIEREFEKYGVRPLKLLN